MRLLNFIYGFPGVGKTRFVYGLDKSIVIDLDNNNTYSGPIEIYHVFDFKETVAAVKKAAADKRAKHIVVDSATILYSLLMDQIPDAEFEGQYGRGWFKLNRLFEQKVLLPLWVSKKHIWFTGHCRVSMHVFKDEKTPEHTIEPYIGSTIFNAIAVRSTQILYIERIQRPNGVVVQMFSAPNNRIRQAKDTTGKLPPVLRLDDKNLVLKYYEAMKGVANGN